MITITKALASLLALASLGAAHPASSGAGQSSDGFPNPNPDQLQQIEITANGRLPDGAPPATLNETTKTIFEVIAANEQFEVAFFKSLYNNITNNVPGYKSGQAQSQQGLAKIIKTIIAQEELHALNALGILKAFNRTAPGPCKYNFQSENLAEAIAFASVFTDNVVGALEDAVQGSAQGGDNGVSRAVASVISNEAEQNGFFRVFQGLLPSAMPFQTTSTGVFAFNWLNNVVTVPNSCPYNVSSLGIPFIPQLFVGGTAIGFRAEAKDQTLCFSADLSNKASAKPYIGGDGKNLFITYFHGALSPFSVPISSVTFTGNVINFEAPFPYSKNVLDGFSVAALTIGGNFTGPDDVIGKSIAAPGFIEVPRMISE